MRPSYTNLWSCPRPSLIQAHPKTIVTFLWACAAIAFPAGFVHRDIRWPNVIYVADRNRWLLIDLEHAGRLGGVCSQAPFPLAAWDNATLEPDRTYSAASDLRMVASHLLSHIPLPSAAAEDFRKAVLDGRLVTAETALQHSWFKG